MRLISRRKVGRTSAAVSLWRNDSQPLPEAGRKRLIQNKPLRDSRRMIKAREEALCRMDARRRMRVELPRPRRGFVGSNDEAELIATDRHGGRR